jgi:serine/threonine protein kinase
LEHLPDKDLFNWRRQHFALEHVEESMRLFSTQLLQALLFLHSVGILHRDIKPQNILLRRSALWTPERATQTLLAFEPVLADFGTAAMVPLPPSVSTTLSSSPSAGPSGGHTGAHSSTIPATLTSEDDIHNLSFETYAGTDGFMAPEVSETGRANSGKTYTSLSDVWSFGATLVAIFVGTHRLKNNVDMIQILEQNRSSMSIEFANLLDGMLARKVENRLTWDQVATHPWFKFPASHAREWLLTQENFSKYDALIRPIQGSSFKGVNTWESFGCISDAKDLTTETYRYLTHLHSEWTTDKGRFYTLYMREWENRRTHINSLVQHMEPFRALLTMKSISQIANSYGPSKARFLMLLEVGKVTMSKLKNSSEVTEDLKEWHLLFEATQRALTHDVIDDIELEPTNSPVRVFPDLHRANELSFHALMHVACVLKYKDYISALSSTIQSQDDLEVDDFMPLPKTRLSFQEIMLGLRELKIVMEYVLTVLPSVPTTGTASYAPVSRSASSSSLSGTNPAFSTSQSLALGPTNEEIVCDYIERISRVIRRLPEEMEAMNKPIQK